MIFKPKKYMENCLSLFLNNEEVDDDLFWNVRITISD